MIRGILKSPLFVAMLSFALLVPVAVFDDSSRSSTAASGPGYWGSCETFWNVTTGTGSSSAIHGFTLTPYTTTDAVVLDGFLYLMTRANMNGTVATYVPPDPPGRTNDWNLSVEVTRPREGSAYESHNITAAAGIQALVVYLTNSTGGILTGVQLVTGDPVNEAILVFSQTTSTWQQMASDLRPAFPHRSDEYGLKPDRYIVSFSHADLSSLVRVTVMNTATGVVFALDVAIASTEGTEDPQLRFDVDMNAGRVSVYNVASGWMLDNLAFRSLLSRYPVAGPSYEVVAESSPLWVQVTDDRGAPVEDATVAINGTEAVYEAASHRYLAFVPRAVDWDVPINYSVLADGVLVNDTMSVSTVLDTVSRISIPKWWNGWDWVTVFGRDDSSTTLSAQQTFLGFDHPSTNYVSSTFLGNSTDLLPTQSEIAVHYPHDYTYWGHKTWAEAMNSTQLRTSTFDSKYWFASRWDDPRYVGKGDSYISIACPGNSASWEQLYAESTTGIRIMGISAQYYLGGNSSLIGSYWLYGPNLTAIPSWASWDPHVRVDMMDMFRAISTDRVVTDQWDIARTIAGARGVLRLYNHGTVATPSFLEWLCEPKTNLSNENWKATDGEVASYVYGRGSVDVSYNESSTTDQWVYNVSRRDPVANGYWRVPVTLAVDISEKGVEDIEIASGNELLRMSDGSLKNLSGARVMDIGYDIRGSTLYVSHFWNESTVLTVKVYGLLNPRFTDRPKTVGVAWEDFRDRLNVTDADNGTNAWSLNTAPGWLSVLESNQTSCLLGGFPEVPGVFLVVLSISDSNNTAALMWYITISKTKVVSGSVLDSFGDPIENVSVMIEFRRGDYIRSIEYVSTDHKGVYSLSFDQALWSPGDSIEVSASMANVTTKNATVADEYPRQEIDLRFRDEVDNTRLLMIVATAASIVAVVVIGALLIRRRGRRRSASPRK